MQHNRGTGMFKPKVVEMPLHPGKFAVRKLTPLGWRYLDLWNYKTWHRGNTWTAYVRGQADIGRAKMALIFNQNPPPF